MQVIAYDRWDWNLYCPVTGTPVFDGQGNPLTPTFRACWVDEDITQPVISDAALQAAWTSYLRTAEEEHEGDIDIDDFLATYDARGFVVFQFTGHGIACGPVAHTMWVVLDLEMEMEMEKQVRRKAGE